MTKDENMQSKTQTHKEQKERKHLFHQLNA